MKRFPLRPVVRAIALMTLAPLGAVWAQTSSSSEGTLQEVKIISVRQDRVSTGATGLDLDIKETPQSISVVTQEQMRDFGTTSLNDALRLTTGIQVEEWETNRTTYTVRGFEVANTQVDGVGMPNSWGTVSGAMETFGYEKIELIRGANGLLTGVGNAAGTINYVRKRPTNKDEGSMGFSYGSWGTTRVEGDYSKRLTEDGHWAGRVVFAREEGKSHLRSNENERTFLYGVVDGQIGDNGMLTAGFSHQQDNSKGVMWGALSFGNSDGTQAEWDRSASTTQDWTKWDTTTQNAFIEYAHQLGSSWQLKASYNYRRITTDTKLFYAFLLDPDGSGPQQPPGLDPVTGAGLVGYASRGADKRNEHLGEVSVNGQFDAFGRRHEALVGVGWAKARFDYDGYDADCSAAAGGVCYALTIPSFPYAGHLVPEPVWGGVSTSQTALADLTEQRKRVFGSTRLSLTDKLKSILGFSYAEYRRDGNNFGTALRQSDAKLSPYAGLTYDITRQLLAYVSYSDLYLPQSQVDINNNYLEPSKGANIEAGVKMDWLDKRLLTTLSVFRAKQSGLAVATGVKNSYNMDVYAPSDFVKSEGFELEAVGKINNYTDLTLGYTSLKLSDRSGATTIFPYVPRHTANWMLRTRVPSHVALSLGVSGRWQSDISQKEGSGYTVRQDSYAVLNTFAAYQLTPKTTLRFNINNITDEKYINTLRYAGYYGAPRNYLVSLNHQF